MRMLFIGLLLAALMRLPCPAQYQPNPDIFNKQQDSLNLEAFALGVLVFAPMDELRAGSARESFFGITKDGYAVDNIGFGFKTSLRFRINELKALNFFLESAYVHAARDSADNFTVVASALILSLGLEYRIDCSDFADPFFRGDFSSNFLNIKGESAAPPDGALEDYRIAPALRFGVALGAGIRFGEERSDIYVDATLLYRWLNPLNRSYEEISFYRGRVRHLNDGQDSTGKSRSLNWMSLNIMLGFNI